MIKVNYIIIYRIQCEHKYSEISIIVTGSKELSASILPGCGTKRASG